MATYEEVIAKARELAAAGDTVGAKRLGEIAIKMRGQPAKAGGITQESLPPPGLQAFEVQGQDGQIHQIEAPDKASAVEIYLRQSEIGGLQAGTGQNDSTALRQFSSDDFRQAAKRAYDAGDIKTTKNLIARGMALEKAQGGSEKSAAPGVAGGIAGAAADGALFGFGDEYLAGLSAALGVQPDGQGGANWFDYSKPMGERYGTALNQIRQEQGQFKTEHPAASIGAEVVGSIAVPGGAGAKFVNKGSGTIARMMRGALTGAGAGAAYGFGEGEGGFEDRAEGAVKSAAIGALGGGSLVGIGQGFSNAYKALSRNPALREAMPTVEGLRETAQGLYAKAKELGGVLPDANMRGMVSGVKSTLQDEGFDSQLHPRVAAVLKRLEGQSGGVSLADMEILRRVAGNAAQSLQPDERRLASKLIDRIDDAVDGMGGGSAALQEARDVWSRLRRMETIETAIEKASLQDDFVAGLRNQFKTLLRNPKILRGFSEAEKKAIKDVATGTATTKALRGLAGILSPYHLPGAALTGGAFASGAGFGSAAIPAASGIAKTIADALTKQGANSARNLAGMPDSRRKLIEALLARPNPAARAAPATGLMGDYIFGGGQ